MTPRQLMALSDQHSAFEGHSEKGAPRERAKPKDNRGSAGWLMAVAHGLDKSRPPGTG